MKKLKFLWLSIVFCASINPFAAAYAMELIPLYGYRGGGEFIDNETDRKHTIHSSEIYGLIFDFHHERGNTYELYYSHQSSKLSSVSLNLPDTSDNADVPLTIDYLHFGGTTPITEEKNFRAFASGGLGFTYLSPDLSGLESDLRASLSIGFGLKMPVTDNIGLRLETRGFATLFNSNASLFCNGGCSLTVNGSMLFQGEVFAGLAIRF